MSDTGFDAALFPSGAAGDITRRHYHDATGLLTAKEYADGSQVTYGYDAATGRFKSVDWNAAGQKDSAAYGYLADSDLIAGLSTTSGKVTSYAYEPHRNLKTGVENAFNTALISNYTYAYDTLGRRTSVANSGSAFAQAAFNAYNYNDRSELITSDRYLGADISDTSTPVSDRQRSYDYDPIGNRRRYRHQLHGQRPEPIHPGRRPGGVHARL